MRSFRQASFCDRHLTGFLLTWCLLLQAEHFCQLSAGRFYQAFEAYAPGWAWGMLMGLLGVGRLYAYFWDHPRLRIAVSSGTVMLLWTIAALALYEKLYAATLPLAVFAAVVASSCHRRTLRASFNGTAKAPPPA